ncbi:hypothetical protein GF312_12415 [Candidatus Poribacteria bacterium]|nr:hypothetical protein [Candidatus Poribacteria bacterium]
MKCEKDLLKKSAHFIMVGILITFVITGSLRADVVADGLVAYWSFDDDTIDGDNIADIVGGNDGILNGGNLVANGKINSAIEFDGATEIDIPGTEDLNFNGAEEMTVAAWFNPDSDDPVGNQAAAGCCGSIVAQRDVNGWALRYDGRNPGQEIEFIVSPGWQGDAGFGAAKVEPNGWHYITGVVAVDIMRVYLDGELVMEQPFSGPMSTTGTETEIGLASDGSFIGMIDEVAIYNRALSDEEVMQNYGSNVFFSVDYRNKLAICWGDVKSK